MKWQDLVAETTLWKFIPPRRYVYSSKKDEKAVMCLLSLGNIYDVPNLVNALTTFLS